MSVKIDIRNFSIATKGKTILSDLSFCLEGNQVLCITGPGASGKSLFLKYLFGLKKAELTYACTSISINYSNVYYVDCNDGSMKIKGDTPEDECDLILIDEPENCIDKYKFHLFRENIRRKNKTLIFVTHHLEFLHLFSDMIVVLRHGSYTKVLSNDEFFSSDDPYISYLSRMGC